MKGSSSSPIHAAGSSSSPIHAAGSSILLSLLNFDPESERDEYRDGAVQEAMMRQPLDAKLRTTFKCGGILHKNVSPLSMACALGASLSVIILICSADSDALWEQTNFGMIPLHYACFCASNKKVVRFLLTKSPESAMARDHAGQVPLHVACWKRADADMIELLLDKYPEGASLQLSDGRLPLHIACSNQASVKVIDLLLQVHPKGAEVAESEGGWMPLHYACRNDAPLAAIESLLNVCPESATMAQCHGWLPLHLACANQAAGDMVRLLLEVSPESASVSDEKGYLPLHVACNYGASIEVIEKLLDTYADGAMVQGKDGSLPLHLACARQIPLPAVEQLVETYPEGMKVRNNEGNTPLEISRIRDEKRKVLIAANEVEQPPKDDSISSTSSGKQNCSQILRHALTSKRPQTAVQLSQAFLRKSTRKFSEQKNKIASDNVRDVFRGLDMRMCTAFAVERFGPDILHADQGLLVQELEDLSRLNHPNLIRLLGYSLPSTSTKPSYLVYELAEGGSLASVLSSEDETRRTMLDWRRRIRISTAIVSALTYLSSQDRVHGSLRPDNIYFWEDFDKVLLTGFGDTRLFQDEELRHAYNLSMYAAPEYLFGAHDLDEYCQVYSVGVILKVLITGKLPSEVEPPGISAQSLILRADPFAGDWDISVLESFASLAYLCMGGINSRERRPTLSGLLESLVQLEHASAEKIVSTENVLDALLHVEQMNALKEESTEHLDELGHELIENPGNGSTLTKFATCQCSRKNVRGVICSKEEGHFCCDRCFVEVVSENLGAPAMLCREQECNGVFSMKQIFDHVEGKVFSEHISEAERMAFLEDLWGRGAKRVAHVQQNEALKALNALASRDTGDTEFPPLCVLSLVTSRRGGSHLANPLSKKRRFLLYFVCAFDKKPIKAAIKISRTRKWLRMASPALKASLVVLDICISQMKGSPMHHNSVSKHMSMTVMEDEINQFADVTWESVIDTFSLFAKEASKDSRNQQLDEARAATKMAYESLSELASAYPDWTKEMKLAANKSGVLGWVKNKNVEKWKKLE